MKRIMIFIASVAIMETLFLIACESKVSMSQDMVPVPVQTSFKIKYPQVKNTLWYLQESKYEAEFSLGAEKKHVWFDGNGMYIKESLEGS